MKGRNPNKQEQEWMDAICQLGCIVCRIHLGVNSPASPHHLEGKTKEGAHLKTIPLCGRHHQIPGDYWKTRHHNKTQFESAYGTEQELLEQTKRLVEKGEL